MGAYSYSSTAGSNTTVDGIASQGTSDANLIDDNIRALAAGLANFVRDLGGPTAGGSADALTVALNDATTLPAYFDQMVVGFIAASDNATTSPTLNVDSVGAKAIKKAVAGAETALAAGDIQAGGYYLARYRSAWASAAGAFQLVDLNHDFLTSGAAAAAYQPLDSDLTAIAGLADPGADRILFWDESENAYKHLSMGLGVSIVGTELLSPIKAWVRFNGTGTPAIAGSYNVTSITDNGTGNYTINFTTAMADANYCVIATGKKTDDTGDERVYPVQPCSYATGSIRVLTTVPTGDSDTRPNAVDFALINVVVLA